MQFRKMCLRSARQLCNNSLACLRLYDAVELYMLYVCILVCVCVAFALGRFSAHAFLVFKLCRFRTQLLVHSSNATSNNIVYTYMYLYMENYIANTIVCICVVYGVCVCMCV